MNKGNQAIIHWAEEGKWLRFRNPVEVFIAAEPQEVVSILDHIEKEVETKKLYAAGFLAYEAGAAFDPALRFRSGGDFPLLWFGLFGKAEPFAVPLADVPDVRAPAWQSSATRAEYKTAIQAIKYFIRQGATYQVNYSYRLRAPFGGGALPYFFKIAGRQNIPYAAFIETDRYAVCSFSPELFFSLNGRVISSKPMKGTMPRGIFNRDDRKIARELFLSEKNRAENVMIVDMVRNDIGRIAAKNTVAVSSLYDVEKYDTVWQMTSSVKAHTSAALVDIFRALFPPASCTGAPKINTVKIIADLETSPRRIYTGSIGFMAPGRKAQFNVAIRTLLVDKLRCVAEYGVGGGIVWDSVDEAEYGECAVKAKVVCSPRPDFELLETMLWTPEESLCPPAADEPAARPGYFLLDSHIARMRESAAYFSFPFEEASLKRKLFSLASGLPPLPHRVRLLLNRKGNINCEAKPYGEASRGKPRDIFAEPCEAKNAIPPCGKPQGFLAKKGESPDKTELAVCLAKRPVASDDVFLYHKTTNRRVYDQAKALRPGYDEVILWNEKGEVTEFCAANIIVDLDGQMLTPSVNCGLLPGTYRDWLLKKGEIKEQVIKIDMLRQCRRIYLCNSVRKMRAVRIEI